MLKEQETAHLPGTMEEPIPVYRKLVERHQAAMPAGDVPAAMKLRDEAHELAVKLNGGNAGICGGPDAPAYVLERATGRTRGNRTHVGPDRTIHPSTSATCPSASSRTGYSGPARAI
jgi:hypothetical protein